MVARDLLRELEGRGVRLAVDGGRLIARAPAGAITPDLAERIREGKDELLRELERAPVGTLAPLPRPLVELVQAAKVNGLNRPGFLPSGIVPNLSEYVLTCAALYACDFDAPRQLAHLWAARAAAAS